MAIQFERRLCFKPQRPRCVRPEERSQLRKKTKGRSAVHHVQNANMVFLWRPESSKNSWFSVIIIAGQKDTDVNKFFFVFVNVFTTKNASSKRVDVILRRLQGIAFDFYNEKFWHDCTLIPRAEDYLAIKQAIPRKFGSKANPEENIREVVSATLGSGEILGSIQNNGLVVR